MKRDFYLVGAVVLFMFFAYLWQVYKEISSEPFVFQTAGVKTNNACKTAPKYEDYRVEAVAGIKGVNFAGKYKISTTTCGQFCEGYSIADLEKDETKELEMKSEVGASFSSTSALFIINPPGESAKALSYYPVLTSFYEIKNGELKLICKKSAN